MMKINAEFNQRNESQLLVSCTYKIDGARLFYYVDNGTLLGASTN